MVNPISSTSSASATAKAEADTKVKAVPQDEAHINKVALLAVKYSYGIYIPKSVKAAVTIEDETATSTRVNVLADARFRKHTYPDTGDCYEGSFKNGMRNGYGEMRYYGKFYGKGNIYKGNWKDDLQDGHGVMEYYGPYKYVYKTYDGEWKDGQYHGMGALYYHSRCRMVGPFVEGKFLGTIIFELDDDLTYKGDYVEKDYGIIFHGKGRSTNKWNVVEGEFHDNNFVKGFIKINYIEKNSYEGEAQRIYDKYARHGQGIMRFSNGDFQEGLWKNDNFIKGFMKVKYDSYVYEGEAEVLDNTLHRHGKGKVSYINGDEVEGFWQQSFLIKGHYKKIIGDMYEGEVVGTNGAIHYHGQGKLIKKNDFSDLGETFQSVYEGTFENNVFMKGRAKISEFDKVYEGEAKRFSETIYKHGQGKMTFSNGDVIEGLWENDLPKKVVATRSTYRFEGELDCIDYEYEPKKGKLVRNNGDIFIGVWESGVFKRGTIKIVEEDKIFVGNMEWLDDSIKRHGRGLFISKRVKLSGFWKEDQFVKGYMEESYHNGTYAGQAESFDSIVMRHGIGKHIFNDGTVHEGTFQRNNFIKGTGRKKIGDNTYVGELEFIGGKVVPSGRGKLNCEIYVLEGVWVNGELDMNSASVVG